MHITEEESDKIVEAMGAFNDAMMELGCDSVQIVATALSAPDGETMHFQLGVGNAYARKAAVAEWIRSTEQEQMASEFGMYFIEDDDDWEEED